MREEMLEEIQKGKNWLAGEVQARSKNHHPQLQSESIMEKFLIRSANPPTTLNWGGFLINKIKFNIFLRTYKIVELWYPARKNPAHKAVLCTL